MGSIYRWVNCNCKKRPWTGCDMSCLVLSSRQCATSTKHGGSQTPPSHLHTTHVEGKSRRVSESWPAPLCVCTHVFVITPTLGSGGAAAVGRSPGVSLWQVTGASPEGPAFYGPSDWFVIFHLSADLTHEGSAVVLYVCCALWCKLLLFLRTARPARAQKVEQVVCQPKGRWLDPRLRCMYVCTTGWMWGHYL